MAPSVQAVSLLMGGDHCPARRSTGGTMSKVLVAYDGSAEAKRALESAAEMNGDTELTVISVVPVTYSGRGGGIDPASTVEDHRVALDEAAAWLQERGREGKTVEAVGHPADSIVAAAEQGEFDMIVMGSRGLNAVERFMMGSTSARVVAHAPCSVLVVR
jgi:nucleotide-binding universal stress UspA family protein